MAKNYRKFTPSALRKTPKSCAPPNPKRGKTLGRQFGMGLTHFLHQLFVNNELLPKSEKRPDGALVRLVQNEYKHNEKIRKAFDGDEGIKELRRRRSAYNRGKLVISEGPPIRSRVSFSYDMDGDPINTRYRHPRKLTKEQIESIRDHFAEERKRWEQGLATTTDDVQ